MGSRKTIAGGELLFPSQRMRMKMKNENQKIIEETKGIEKKSWVQNLPKWILHAIVILVVLPLLSTPFKHGNLLSLFLILIYILLVFHKYKIAYLIFIVSVSIALWNFYFLIIGVSLTFLAPYLNRVLQSYEDFWRDKAAERRK